MTNQLVADWFEEIACGDRQPRKAEVSIDRIRPNPFAPTLDQDYLAGVRRDIERGRDLPTLLIGEMPSGDDVDVDTPYACEAYRQTGRKVVSTWIVGEFTAEDCERIGLLTP
jgi:hypothetical protein